MALDGANLLQTEATQHDAWASVVSWFHPHWLVIWGFPYMEVPQNGCFIRENPIKMDDLEVPQFQETSI